MKVYNRVIANIKNLVEASVYSKNKIDISANYLITKVNSSKDQIFNGVKNLIEAGVDSIRFSFPQLPRGKDDYKDTIIPNRKEVLKIYENIKPVIE